MPKGTVELVSIAEYARRRGCTEGAVRRAAREGRICLIDGKVDPVAADAQWAANTRVRAGSAPAAQGGPGEAGDTSGTYWQSRAKREAAEAEVAEMRLRELRRELVRVDEVRHLLGRRLSAAREILLGSASRLAPLLATEADQVRCAQLLEGEMHRALGEISGAAEMLPAPTLEASE